MSKSDPTKPTNPALHIGFSGRLAWALVNAETGDTEAAGEGENLITDTGLDALASMGFLYFYNGSRGSGAFRDYCAVGTSSTAPATNQTTLGAEVARVIPSVMPTVSKVSDGVYDVTVTHEFLEAQANGNLTEFGYSTASAGNGPVGIRALFKDGSGNPITVTKTNKQKLRLVHTLRVTLGPLTVQSINIPFTGDLTARNAETVLVYQGNKFTTSNDDDINGINNMMKAGAVLVGVVTADQVLSRNMIGSAGSITYPPATVTHQTYNAGTYTRKLNAMMDTGSANVTHYGYVLAWERYGSYYYEFFRLRLLPGNEFVKDNLHQLTLFSFTLTWGRA